jgi:homoserine O-acetyltransferase
LHLAYTTHGELNADKSNVVWIFHALTANSNPAEWWPGLVGEQKLFDPEKYFTICVNMPGSCYGSIGPLDNDPLTDRPYYHNFPMFTTRDMVRVYRLLKDELGFKKIHIGIGGSMGGQQLLEWAIEEQDLFEFIFPIATNAEHSSWGVAFNASQRWCIENDATWKEENVDAGLEGMKIARSIALISYRHYETYFKSQHGFTTDTEGSSIDKQIFKAETYQRYQGEKLAKRFNAFSYYFLSQGMDKHNVGRGRDSVRAALQSIKAKTMVISISSDILYPTVEQELLAAYIPNAQLRVIDSYYGHDGFLLEYETIETLVKEFISKERTWVSNYR